MRYLLALLLFSAACSSHVSVRRDFTVCRYSTLAIVDVYVTESQKTEPLPQIGQSFANALAGHLLEAGLNVVEREKVGQLLKEMRLGQSGLIDASKLSEIGRLINADFILTGVGEVRMSGQSTFLANTSMRLIEVATGQIVMISSWDGPSHTPVQVANLLGPDMGKAISKQIVTCRNDQIAK